MILANLTSNLIPTQEQLLSNDLDLMLKDIREVETDES